MAFRLDQRITVELKAQKRPLVIGLVCSGIGALLYAITIKLTQIVLRNMEDIGSNGGDSSLSNLIRRIASSLEIDRAIDPFQQLLISCGLIALVFAVRYIFVRCQTYYLAEAIARLTTELRRKLMTKLLRLPITYYNETRSGAVQSVLTNDVNVFQSTVSILKDSIEAPIKAIVALALIISIQWQMSIVTLLMIPILGIIVQRNSIKMRQVQNHVQSDIAEVGAVTQETLQGVRVVKAFGAESLMDSNYRDLTEISLQSQLKAANVVAALKPLVEFLGAMGLVTAFILGGYLAKNGSLRVSDIATMAFALDAINQGFKGISNLSSTYSSVQAAADRIYTQILDVEEPPESGGNRTLETVRGDIQFNDVSFDYPDGTSALKNVSFGIPAGTSLALVGPSGAGKSTIADLMLRFYQPSSGTITLDGVDIQTLDAIWLRKQIGVVPQQTFLFAGTIEENLKLGYPQATPSEIKTALGKAHASEFSAEFAERDVAIMGERGVRLSGGQMQRIAIARALIHQPRMLLLDEATSALDAASEKAVTEALAEVMDTATTLFIAHRLTTAARADSIILLKRGRVMEQGTHAELIAKNGDYAALFRVFSSGVFEGEIA
jgi:ATP-binding cassette, subfamily B, bacterial MsbA